MGGQVQTRLRSPKASSTQRTLGQNVFARTYGAVRALQGPEIWKDQRKDGRHRREGNAEA